MPTPVIDTTYFKAELNIAQLGQLSVREAVQGFIDQREPEALLKMLGPALYEAYRNRTEPLAQRWMALVEGAGFMVGAQMHYWAGLRGIGKRSPVAGYVYYWYQRDGLTVTTGIGEVLPKGQNSTTADGSAKMVYAWNLFSEGCATVRLFLSNHRDLAGELVYPEYFLSPPASKGTGKINVFGI